MAFTRLLLTKPDVFLLDEPTASMDNRQEQRCLQVLRQELSEGQTFIVSTHKTALLDLVDRIIIMDNQRIIIDGPKQAVLDELRKNDQGSDKTSTQPSNRPAQKANPSAATVKPSPAKAPTPIAAKTTVKKSAATKPTSHSAKPSSIQPAIDEQGK